MTDKQRIDQIAVLKARDYLTFKLGGRKGLDVEEIVGDDEIYAEIVNELAEQFKSLAESPEYLQAILPDGVEAVCHVAHDETGYFGVLDENVKVGTSLYTASAILASTAPLKAEIERLKSQLEFMTENCKGLATNVTDYQDKVKVLADALDEMVESYSHKQRLNIQKAALATVRGK